MMRILADLDPDPQHCLIEFWTVDYFRVAALASPPCIIESEGGYWARGCRVDRNAGCRW